MAKKKTRKPNWKHPTYSKNHLILNGTACYNKTMAARKHPTAFKKSPHLLILHEKNDLCRMVLTDIE